MSYKKVEAFRERVGDLERRRGGEKRAFTDEQYASAARVLANYGIKGLIRRADATEAIVSIPRKLAAAAGDLVHADEARVTDILPRGKVLARADARRAHVMAANVDRVLLIQSASLPAFSEGLTDRYLVYARIMNVPLVLVLNKMDEADAASVDRALAFRETGVDVHLVSAKTGDGVDAIARIATHGVSVFTGHSGVGKSHLLSALLPGEDLKVGRLNLAVGKGRQTTTVARAYPFREGLVIDTPGVREFQFVGATPGDVTRAFPDIAMLSARCKFRDCRHETEPGCAVKQAVKLGELSAARLASFARILESLDATD
ncbi:ribosome small subunit-dependent GTPase A [bacterium]|nr:ribosome small subunit-dependent GTPase A [bacterium]